MSVNFKTSIEEEYNNLFHGKNEIFKYIDYDSGLKILSNSTLAFKSPINMNDPYDCSVDFLDFSNPSEDFIRDSLKIRFANLDPVEGLKAMESAVKKMKPETDGILQKSIENDLKKRGITCFSEINNNLLMWSHYGKSHTGICIGFDLKKLYGSVKINHPFGKLFIKVKYETEFKVMDYFANTEESVVNWVRTKSIDWSYEKEYRFIISNLKFNKAGLYILPIDKNCIKHVYLGSQMSKENEAVIRELLKNNYNEVPIIKLQLSKNRFELIDG